MLVRSSQGSGSDVEMFGSLIGSDRGTDRQEELSMTNPESLHTSRAASARVLALVLVLVLALALALVLVK